MAVSCGSETLLLLQNEACPISHESRFTSSEVCLIDFLSKRQFAPKV